MPENSGIGQNPTGKGTMLGEIGPEEADEPAHLNSLFNSIPIRGGGQN